MVSGKAQIAYVERGSGYPVILIHGFGCSSVQWMYTAPALAASGFRAIAVDLPGFGESYLPEEPISTASYSRVLLDFMDHLHITDAALVGSSMGGFVSWRAASLAPDRVKALLLSDSAGAPPCRATGYTASTIPAGQEARAKRASRMTNGIVRGFSRRLAPLAPFLLRPFGRLMASRFMKISFGNPDRLTPEISLALHNAARKARIVFAGRLKWSPLEEDVAGALTRVRCPTLIVWGDADRVIPVTAMDFFVSRLPDAESVVLQGVGHVPMLEVPQEFNKVMLNFLKRRIPADGPSGHCQWSG